MQSGSETAILGKVVRGIYDIKDGIVDKESCVKLCVTM